MSLTPTMVYCSVLMKIRSKRTTHHPACGGVPLPIRYADRDDKASRCNTNFQKIIFNAKKLDNTINNMYNISCLIN